MIYGITITTGKGTVRYAPSVNRLYVTKGLVYKIEIDFPPGSAGLLGVAIYDGGFQVWPSTLGEWFTGDGILISFDDVYLKETEPYVFDIYTYNEDDTYDHSVTVRLGFVSKEIFMARFLPTVSYKYFEEMMLRLQRAQQQLALEQKIEREKTPYQILFG